MISPLTLLIFTLINLFILLIFYDAEIEFVKGKRTLRETIEEDCKKSFTARKIEYFIEILQFTLIILSMPYLKNYSMLLYIPIGISLILHILTLMFNPPSKLLEPSVDYEAIAKAEEEDLITGIRKSFLINLFIRFSGSSITCIILGIEAGGF